ncbi:hypothetical protein D9619_010249 [Psilocybe cf. subviscida]|uniref:Yeast cell wall synthesis Kre9/Knh1-like N-terminal domain-containing protein n=1 Tax=Psilocybe cf. subviscida TaxID=2480587 RepID=A0A8H5ASC3_9AGAR|nr:hypothetical protein D9619_010249 [Psilocybe cf. subviscida]
MASLVLLLIFLNLFSGALGTLYPIKPVSGTVFSAGMPAQVKWMEDNKKPFLNSTGTVQIDLYAGKNTYIATIAKGIDPTSGATTVFIPSFVPGNYHAFVLRFITTEPPQTIYTADFAIIPNPASISVKGGPRTATPSTVVSTSTVISRVMGTGTGAGTGTSGTGSGSGAGQGSASPAEKTATANSAGRRAKAAAHTWNEPRGTVDLFTVDTEKMKFRIVFIVWPTLVGLSMAL